MAKKLKDSAVPQYVSVYLKNTLGQGVGAEKYIKRENLFFSFEEFSAHTKEDGFLVMKHFSIPVANIAYIQYLYDKKDFE